ncbi:hypothetical protein MTR_2g042930 [Medicago truncatula]|uniref:HAT C-terminal dimerisation domain-containing protein n=1 Tax=Medicago truncatula TaxID=3880 RepID=G7IIQ6_MEDTR|nr:hypothetical protein MTR_2g042930 [Medicago truncatula]
MISASGELASDGSASDDASFFRASCLQNLLSSKPLFFRRFNHAKSFATFDVNKLLRLDEFYPNDFLEVLEVGLRHQLRNYVINVQSNPKFELQEFLDPCSKLLLKLALLLPIATTCVERIFSTMKVVKNQLCNTISD